MSPNIQPGTAQDPRPAFHSGLHPDAEALNAFAEQALAEPERQQILAHAAQCSRCREILFLAQAAAEPVLPASTGSVLPFRLNQTRRIPVRLSNWRFAGAAAAAALALAALSLFLMPKHTQPALQALRQAMPKPVPQSSANQRQAAQPANRPAPPQPGDALDKPLARPHGAGSAVPAPPPNEMLALRSSAGVAASPPMSAVSSSTAPPAPKAIPQWRDEAAAPQPRLAMPAAVQPSSPATVMVQQAPPAGIVSESVSVEPLTTLDAAQPMISAAPGKSKVESASSLDPNPPQMRFQLGDSPQAIHPEPDRKQRAAGGTMNGAMKASRTGPASSDAPLAEGGAARGVLGAATVTGRAKPADAASAAKPVSSEDSGNDLESARKALHVTLPSGLQAVSTAAAGRHLLAVDSGGALFRSEDAGNSWEPVLQQWTGRATRLRLASPSPTELDLSKKAVPAPAAPYFEMVTAEGGVWISGDGRTWTAK